MYGYDIFIQEGSFQNNVEKWISGFFVGFKLYLFDLLNVSKIGPGIYLVTSKWEFIHVLFYLLSKY